MKKCEIILIKISIKSSLNNLKALRIKNMEKILYLIEEEIKHKINIDQQNVENR